eukprot:TRINITY_DN8806_c5_g1_i1.p1 TRINITY_DN8806_c5_g1~~TRINITY_DN8806_c5_g1_i1.p1  ORF type:complete len:104 (+),score=17.01 TRINITY_DN8806_c5_g1_i1:75-386(+)
MEYTDGCNNRYSLNDNILSYRGMAPRMSSSGRYSGGPDKQVHVSPEVARRLMELVNAAAADVSQHETKRSMGMPVVSVGSLSFILNGSKHPKKLESALKAAFL